jgi:MFS family permease
MTEGTRESGSDGNSSSHGDGWRNAADVESAEDRLFTSNFVFATLANFINSFGMQMLVATLPVYVITLGGSQADAGLVSGVLALTALVFRPLLGWLTDAWRRRPLVLMGTSFYGLASMVYLLAGSIPLLVLGRLVHGFGLSCYTTASNAYVADIAPVKRRAEAVGIYAAAQDFGLIMGPVTGFMLVGLIGFQHLFYFTGGLAFTAFSISILPKEHRPSWKIKRQPWSPRTSIVAVDALPIAWMALCMGIGFGAINAFISIFAQSRGVQNPGFYFMVQAVALLASRTPAGRLADRCGRAITIIPGVMLMVLAIALLPLARGFPNFVISASLFGMGFGSAQPATMALLIDRVRPEQRGLATSTYFTGFDGGISIGAILLGVVSQHWGFGVMWPISAACTLLSPTGIMVERHHRSRNRAAAK